MPPQARSTEGSSPAALSAVAALDEAKERRHDELIGVLNRIATSLEKVTIKRQGW